MMTLQSQNVKNYLVKELYGPDIYIADVAYKYFSYEIRVL
jgi:cbb3-type cytochrome oxidase cytochrome c subunit